MAKFKIPFEKTTTGYVIFEAADKAEAEKYERALMYGKELVFQLDWNDSFDWSEASPEVEDLPGYVEKITNTSVNYSGVK